ncbi:MAG TPA: hypothetical protein VFO16_04285 [Pseudonocardiaceae bacterium]|nr:hypothetical protein [Pseudonocardiaceae bacterium]
MSGGFSTADEILNANPIWDIVIVGRGVTDAVDPATAAGHLINHLNALRPRDHE